MPMPYVIPPLGLTPRQIATLTSSVEPLPDEAIFDDRGIPRWMQGVTFQSVGCEPLERIAAALCEPANKTARELGDIITFNAFTVYDGQTGSLICTEIERIDGDQQLRYPSMVSAQLGAELMYGGSRPFDALTPNINPSLSSAADLVAGGPYNPNDALALLEQAAADYLHGAQATLHLTPRGFSHLNFFQQGVFGDGRWTTAQGNLMVADAGYSPTPDGIAAEWWYASGPVFYALTEFVPLGLPFERIDFAKNQITSITEATALVVFDPCGVVAVPVCYDDGCAPSGS